MRLSLVAAKLQEQREVTFVARGNSMKPKIRHGDTVTVERVDPNTVEKGDIVLARLGRYIYLHLVSAVEPERVQISNNHGHINGWAQRRNVLGRLKRREPSPGAWTNRKEK